MPSSSRGRDHIEDTYEAQNDDRLDDLHSKLRTLRGVTTDIYEDVEQQNFTLDTTRDTFSSFGSSLAESSRRAGQAFGIGKGGVKQWRMIGYIVCGMLGLWVVWRVLGMFWFTSTPSTPAPP
ncbi:hypothetical protein EIP91_012420 [Steccherinum ochraceum]|uniref:t-SNARE coiled-coil homology domain-containing protein n=1 Tax=Steccherinum ochraceum TaxID=92696 RepID=A0A4R0RMY2_9APHY|nr:hypothetical protein EIP91_012420 [Steccherinum ochraceum]